MRTIRDNDDNSGENKRGLNYVSRFVLRFKQRKLFSEAIYV